MTTIQPELWVDAGASAVSFYENAFGARRLHMTGDGEDVVAQLAIGEAVFWVATAGASSERLVPRDVGGSTGRILLVVDDPTAVQTRAVAAARPRSHPSIRSTGGSLAGLSIHTVMNGRSGNHLSNGLPRTQGDASVRRTHVPPSGWSTGGYLTLLVGPASGQTRSRRPAGSSPCGCPPARSVWLLTGLRSSRAPPVRCGSRGVCPALSSTARLAIHWSNTTRRGAG